MCGGREAGGREEKYMWLFICYVYSEVPQARCHSKEGEFTLNLLFECNSPNKWTF